MLICSAAANVAPFEQREATSSLAKITGRRPMWKNVRIGYKLAFGFGLVVSVLIILGVLGIVLFASLDRYVEGLSEPGMLHESIHGIVRDVANAKLILAAALFCGLLLASAAAWTITQSITG